MDDVASMLMEAVRLFGVKTTSNRLAVNPEFSWHAASELDRSTYSALAGRTAVAKKERRTSGFLDRRRILAGLPTGGPGSAGDRSQVGCRGGREWSKGEPRECVRMPNQAGIIQ